TLNFDQKGPPGSQPKGLKPWFLVPERRNAELKVIFGHWAALGYYRDKGVYALDSGCVWGGQLTALELDGEGRVFRVDCKA
ncbi:MAG: diadenosine tetraphosphatase, partial [Candidatus Competibacteraceae bacterium]|nr:diadenosine tetraphosphatase [Candidatus Competibacteraceae bacterium]